jgi:glycogen debranching enzyme
MSNSAGIAQPLTMQAAVGYAVIPCFPEAQTDARLSLKHGRYMMTTDRHGDIAPPGHCSLGLFENDTRLLSHYVLRVRGGTPTLLSVQSPHSFLGQIDLAVSDVTLQPNAWDTTHCIHVRRELLVADRFVERITLTNYHHEPLDYWVELQLGCDFADIFEVRGWKREMRGQFFTPQRARKSLVFSYQGLDGSVIRSQVQFRQAPAEITPTSARWTFKLPPRTPYRLEWEVFGEEEVGSKSVLSGVSLDDRLAQLDEGYTRWQSLCSRWTTNPPHLRRHLDRAADDLHSLYTDTLQGRIITAGTPWYATVFGRDAILCSLQTLPLNPLIATDTLRYLAAQQGEQEVAFTAEQPGKILHELRRGEMARNLEVPHVPYYGSVDSTPLWLILLHETWRWTGDDDLVRELLPNAERALDWITKYGDPDGDGFVEYGLNSDGKLVHQGWKTSRSGIIFPDGTPVSPSVALVEVQGYVYDALIRMAALFRIFGKHERADQLRAHASGLREQIVSQFWNEETGTFALALDGEKKPVPTVTSNAGHLLWSGVPEPWQAERMAEVLTGPNLFSGWGIRTMSAAHRAYNPMGYHHGSVWPQDNALIVLGLARYGLSGSALPIVRGLYEAAGTDDFQRLPELICGMPRNLGAHPVWYPNACSPQACASGAFFMMLQAVLGLQPDASAGILHIRNPVLPTFLEELTLSKLAIGHSRVSLHFRQHGDRTLANLLSVSGDPLRVQIELN